MDKAENAMFTLLNDLCSKGEEYTFEIYNDSNFRCIGFILYKNGEELSKAIIKEKFMSTKEMELEINKILSLRILLSMSHLVNSIVNALRYINNVNEN